jgi:hypothetical protein
MVAAAVVEQAKVPPPAEGAANIVEAPDTPSATGTVGDKEFLPEGVNPEQILAPLRDMTGLQAENALRPYAGKWVRVSGIVRAANALPQNGALIGLQLPEQQQLTFAVFRPVPDQVVALEIGDVVEVEGRLDTVNGNSLILEESALLSVAKL